MSEGGGNNPVRAGTPPRRRPPPLPDKQTIKNLRAGVKKAPPPLTELSQQAFALVDEDGSVRLHTQCAPSGARSILPLACEV